MRRLASDLGVSQPVIYSVFPAGRQSLVDAVATEGFGELAEALEQTPDEPEKRARTYLEWAARHPRLYEAMFSMPTGLQFGEAGTSDALRRAFEAIEQTFPGAGRARAEVAWAMLHGLATLESGGRLPASGAQPRFDYTLAALRADP